MANTKPRRHGTETEYNKYKCRCRPCTDAYTAACIRRRKGKQGRTPKTHGTLYAYKVNRCRCAECRFANVKAMARYRGAAKSGTPTVGPMTPEQELAVLIKEQEKDAGWTYYRERGVLSYDLALDNTGRTLLDQIADTISEEENW